MKKGFIGFLMLGVLTMLGWSGTAQAGSVTIPVNSFECVGDGLECGNSFRFTVQDAERVVVKYAASGRAEQRSWCPITMAIAVDGKEMGQKLIGWKWATGEARNLPTDMTVVMDGLESGEHTVSLHAIRTQGGGCKATDHPNPRWAKRAMKGNDGQMPLRYWSGEVTVTQFNEK